MMNLRFKSFGNCSKGTCKLWVHRTPEPCKEWVSSPGRWEVVGWIGSLSTSLPVSHSTWQSPTEPVLSKWCAMNKQGNPAFCGRLDFSTGLSDPLKLTEQEIKYTPPSLCFCYELVRVWQGWEGPGGIFFLVALVLGNALGDMGFLWELWLFVAPSAAVCILRSLMGWDELFGAEDLKKSVKNDSCFFGLETNF